VRLRRLEQAAAVRPSPVTMHSMPGSGGGCCLAPVKPSNLPATGLLLPPAPRLAASDGAALRRAPAAAPAGAYKRGHRRGEPRRRLLIPSHTRSPPCLPTSYTPPHAFPAFPTCNEQPRGRNTPLPPATMAVSRSLLVSLAVALLALLSVAAVSPADAAVAVQAASDPEALHIEGLSRADEDPALASLTVHTRYGGGDRCKGYFKCSKKTVIVVAKDSYLCYFKEAPSSPRYSRKAPTCNPLPYNCKPAKCKGWQVCTCDTCKKIKFTRPIYCEL